MHRSLRETLREFCSTAANVPVLDGKSAHVRALLELIHTAPFSPGLSAKALRAQCGASDHNVSSHFKFETGASIMGYVTALRVQAAASCLRAARSSAVEVALAVGFTSLQRFYAAFKSAYQMTPGEYIRQYRPAEATTGRVAEVLDG